MLAKIFVILTIAQCYVYSTSGCKLEIPTAHRRSEILLDFLKFKKPVNRSPSPDGKLLQLECASGYSDNALTSSIEHAFQCDNDLFNQTYKYEDLLCRSDFHKNDIVRQVPASSIGSRLLKCDAADLKVYQVGVRKADGKSKHLYTVCLDEKVMRTKYSFRPSTNESPKPQRSFREDEVWGFDQYGQNTDEKLSLSQGYVKRQQQRRITKLLPNRYDTRNEYPYYFNRGHLVAHADFTDHDEQVTTVQYLNAAPQWELLNNNSWSLVERESRDMLRSNPADWEMYTGTYGNIPTERGPMFLTPIFHENGRFKKGLLPVPMLFWKVVHNTKDRTKSRAFVGVNNPEFKLPEQIPQSYRICSPIPDPKDKKKLFQGSEFFGFTYECNLDQFLSSLRSEKIVV